MIPVIEDFAYIAQRAREIAEAESIVLRCEHQWMGEADARYCTKCGTLEIDWTAQGGAT